MCVFLSSFFYGIKLLSAFFVLLLFKKKITPSQLWTIGEKITEARDNGYWLYRYIRSVEPDFPIYYVIKKGVPDELKLDKGHVLYYGSFKHCLYSLAAEKCISGQTHWNIPYYNEKGISWLYDRIKNKNQRKIWISHGVKKDKIMSYDYRVSGYDLMTVAVKREYDYYKKEFNLPSNRIALTGLCRFDELYSFTEKNQVLIMPTFRGWLRTSDSSKEMASADEAEVFISSSFYRNYSRLLLDKELMEVAKNNGVRIVFYLHYTFQPYSFLFKRILPENYNEIITIAGREDYDVQTLLKESRLLITDYSSVYFDFAYMNKPVVYFQFDKLEYRERHYKEGYFSYENDGFGPIFEKEEDVVGTVSRYISTGFPVEKEYKCRMDSFFIPHDCNNCKRTFEIIKSVK